jgi:hypothetical protein
MRIRKRYVVLALASALALATGGIAQANNVSTLSGSKIIPSKLSANTFKPVSLFVHTGTVYTHPTQAALGGKAKTVTLYFDDDGTINLTGIPKCTATFSSGSTIAAAWERCGPGADTAPEVNAYLSPPTAVSGRTSTSPASNFGGCTLVFRGPDTGTGNPTVLLFARITTTPNSVPNCSSPATNNTGNTTVTLKGTITTEPAASDFGKRLTVPGIDQLPLPLDDFTALTKRSSVITARCHDTNKILNMKGVFQYSGSGEATDVVNHSQACTVG